MTSAPVDPASLDGFGAGAAEGPFADRPELLIAAALLGGLVLAGIVSWLGS